MSRLFWTLWCPCDQARLLFLTHQSLAFLSFACLFPTFAVIYLHISFIPLLLLACLFPFSFLQLSSKEGLVMILLILLTLDSCDILLFNDYNRWNSRLLLGCVYCRPRWVDGGCCCCRNRQVSTLGPCSIPLVACNISKRCIKEDT